MAVEIPPPVDASGNITVPAGGGVVIPVRQQDQNGNPQDISSLTFRLRIRDRIDKTLVADPNYPMGKLLILTAEEGDKLPTVAVPFTVLDMSNPAIPLDVWVGTIRRLRL